VRLFGEDDDIELVDGMVVQRVAAKDIHEDLFRWLFVLLTELRRNQRSWHSSRFADGGQDNGASWKASRHRFRSQGKCPHRSRGRHLWDSRFGGRDLVAG
jgi:hypothetical protein